MAMSWELVRGNSGPQGETVIVTEHWYLTEDRTRVVKEGDPAGRWLWASPGTEVRKADALRLGALKEEPTPEPEKPYIAELVEDGMDPEKAAKAVTENPLNLDDPAQDASGVEPEREKAAEEKKAPAAPNKARKAAPNKAAKAEVEDK